MVIFGDNKYNTNIFQIVNDPRINFVKLTPSHLKMMNELDLEKCGITTILTGGEAFPSNLAKSIYDKLGGRAALVNGYGATELAAGCIFHKFDPSKDVSANVPIGTAIDNTHIYLLDKAGKPVKLGELGEICVGGVGLARGCCWQN